MAELAMLADIQRKVCPEEVTRQLPVMAQARVNSLVIDRRSNHCATPPTITVLCNFRRQLFNVLIIAILFQFVRKFYQQSSDRKSVAFQQIFITVLSAKPKM